MPYSLSGEGLAVPLSKATVSFIGRIGLSESRAHAQRY